jgi:hypothetical protein
MCPGFAPPHAREPRRLQLEDYQPPSGHLPADGVAGP